MENIVLIAGFCLAALILGTHVASLYYQRKMRAFSKDATGLIQQIAALEFFLKKQDSRLFETHQIAVRMENILKAVVESSCDDDSCKHMNTVLNEFHHLKERNDKILGKLRIKEGL